MTSCERERTTPSPPTSVGSIVYIERGLYQVSGHHPLLVIDGQQRLTTVMLILEAVSRHLGEEEPVAGFSAKKLRNYYLLNSLEEGERGFKLILTQTDKQSLLALMQQKPQPAEHSIRIADNFAFFEKQVARLGDNLTHLCNGLAKLVIVDIALNRDQDNPQLIFESMNSTGRELSQADLIRNFILMGLDTNQQQRLYKEHWRPMEVAFGQEAYGKHFDRFMRHYLTLKTGDIPKIRAVYDPSLAGGFVFYLVRGHTRRGCFHYIRGLRPVVGLGDGGFVPGAGVGSDSGECPGLEGGASGGERDLVVVGVTFPPYRGGCS